MKKDELLKDAEKCLAFYEENLTHAIERGDFHDADCMRSSLSGALYMLRQLGLMTDMEGSARGKAAFERYIAAKYPKTEKGGQG